MTIIARLDNERQEVREPVAEFVLFRDLKQDSNKEWLVRNLLGVGEASTVYGQPGSGKSVLVEDMALHVAAGWPWHGRPVKQGAVLYIALERRRLVERRALAFQERYGVEDLPLAIAGRVHDFRDPRTAAHFVDVARQVERATEQAVVLICVDTLSRALCGGDENSPKDMGAIVNATSILQDGTGAHVQWVHHMPLDGGERMRGHGALLGAMDTTVHVVKTEAVRTATVIKANDSEEGERIAFRLESVVTGTDRDGVDTTAPVVVPADAMSASRPPPSRKLSDRHKIALSALTESILSAGKPAPAAFQLPGCINVVELDRWRDELFTRGVLDRQGANPRQDFIRIRDALAARNLIGTREGVAWPAS